MSLKKCDKCGEDADAAKAFCPECGNPFVYEEKRMEASEFEKQAGTVAYSKTMFNMMLSKMDLDTSRSPEEEKQTRHRSEEPPEKRSLPEMPAGQEKKSGLIKWIILAALGAVILFLVLIAVLFVLYIYFYKQF